VFQIGLLLIGMFAEAIYFFGGEGEKSNRAK